MNGPIEHPLVVRLRALGHRSTDFVQRRERTIVWIAASIFVAVVTKIGLWKIWALAYNGLDLAIYRQVAASSIDGRLFAFTIHPHSYLGDHLELFYAALFPVYAVAQHPLTLIVLQAVALALAVFPFAAISRHFLGKPWGILAIPLYLGNPVIQNMALFEFHILPFAIPLLAWAIWQYLQRRLARFLLCCLLAMTVREDVSLVIFGLGILAAIERRPWRWRLAPVILGAAWFVAAMAITSQLSGYGQYKFIAYYQWLGATPSDMIMTVLTKPWIPLAHLFAPGNIAFLLAVLLPFAYLPIGRWRWLVPVVPIFLQLLLVQSPGELLVTIHYPSLLIPFLVVGAIAAIQAILRPPPSGLFHRLGRERGITLTIVLVVSLYSAVVIGPFIQSVPILAGWRKIADAVALEREIVRSVPTDGAALTSFEALTELSDRPALYSAHYVFLGKKQFSELPYVVPNDVTTVVLDLRDFLAYQLLYRFSEGNDIRDGYRRMRDWLDQRGFILTEYFDRFLVYRRTTSDPVDRPYQLVSATADVRASVHGPLSLVAAGVQAPAIHSIGGRARSFLPIDITLQKTAPSDDIQQLEVQFRREGKVAHRTVIPLGAGLLPTTDWAVQQAVKSSYRLLLPTWLETGTYELVGRVMSLDGEVGLNAIRSLQRKYSTYRPLGSEISFGSFVLGTTR